MTTGPPLTIRIVSVNPARIGTPIPYGLSPNTRIQLNYGDIDIRGASIVHLDKIIDPKTTEKELEPITNPHVRLTRRMYLRDPATAPSSGSRVPYVFCEPDNPSVLQYLRAEDPTYAKLHNMKIDPIYYLEKQCANAWGQILNTICPGVVDELFSRAYELYEKRQSGQLGISSFWDGSLGESRKRITLDVVAKAPAPANANVTSDKKSKGAKGTKGAKGGKQLVKGQSSLSKYFIGPDIPKRARDTHDEDNSEQDKKQSGEKSETKKPKQLIQMAPPKKNPK